MKTILINSFITSLFLLIFTGAYAEDTKQTSTPSDNKDEKTINIAQFVLPPPSPFFGSGITAVDTQATTAERPNEITTEVITIESLDTNRHVFELEAALKEYQQKAANLIEELHATAKNSDFENEMYEKTVTALQQKIDTLKNEKKTLNSKLSSMESDTASQLRLLNTLKQDSAELKALKSTYKVRNDEVIELKKQLANKTNEAEPNASETEVTTLRSAFTAKSEEAEALKVKIANLNEKLKSYDQTKAELTDIQDEATESNENNELLKSKVVELDNSNKSLKSQLDKMQQDASQNTRKLGILNQSSAELTSLKSAYKERNDEAITLRGTVQELENNNKTLISKISKLENEEGEQLRKLGLLEQTTAELTALKSAYKERNDEATKLKAELAEFDSKNKSLLAESETMKAESSHNLRKLNLFDQTTAELTALKSAYKERNDEVVMLNKKLTELGDNNKTLLAENEALKAEKSQNLRKLNLFQQTSAELTALKSAYKERNDEVSSLKEKLAAKTSEHTEKLALFDQSSAELSALKNAQKENIEKASSLTEEVKKLKDENLTLKSKLTTAEREAGSQVRKLASFSKASTELTALKSAYQDKNKENIELKETISEANKKLMALEGEHQTLKKTNKTLSDNNSDLTIKLNESRTHKSSLESSNKELERVKANLNKSENLRKTLSSQIQTLEANSATQTRQLTNLTAITNELAAVKSAYSDLKKEKMSISTELETATADSDNDGVVNKLDKCPNSKQDSPVDKQGCLEIADADGDKVADANDLCPNTAANLIVNDFGCIANQSITLEGVNFNIGSAQLTQSSLPIINTAALTLRQNPTINVEVAGYTDNLGAKSINRRLSQRRANAVAKQLIEQGVDANRITAKGYGESNPVASNNTEVGQLKNRRVELKIR